VETSETTEREEFRGKIKAEWNLMWRERYDDRIRAEAVAIVDYPLLFVDRGCVVYASRNAKAPVFREIVEAWATRGFVYSPEPKDGGWRKWSRTELRKVVHKRARIYVDDESKSKNDKQHLKKGGRGWLHK
jgi:hypothetical protein